MNGRERVPATSWWRHAATRAAQYVLLMLAVASLLFALPRLMPGDPVQLLLGEDAARLPEADIQAALAEFGLDRPLPAQYAGHLADLARGDLGFSLKHRQPVGRLIAGRLPWTLLLVGSALVASTVAGVIAGTVAAWWRGRRVDGLGLFGFVTLESIPSFWIGLLLLVVFAGRLGWLPAFGAVSQTTEYTGLAAAGDVARHLLLPLTTLVLAAVGGVFLVTRYALISTIGEDHLTVARAKGLRATTIALRHALPAAALPIVTAVFLRVGFLVGGAVVIETVFSYPGVGRLLYEAALGRDYPVVQGGFLVLAITVIGANMAADLLYPMLDPRVRAPGVTHAAGLP